MAWSNQPYAEQQDSRNENRLYNTHSVNPDMQQRDFQEEAKNSATPVVVVPHQIIDQVRECQYAVVIVLVISISQAGISIVIKVHINMPMLYIQ